MVSLVPSATKRFGEIKTSTTLTPMAINQEEASQEDASCVGSNQAQEEHQQAEHHGDRKSTRLNSSHANISYAVFCLKKKKITCWTKGCWTTKERYPLYTLRAAR